MSFGLHQLWRVRVEITLHNFANFLGKAFLEPLSGHRPFPHAVKHEGSVGARIALLNLLPFQGLQSGISVPSQVEPNSSSLPRVTDPSNAVGQPQAHQARLQLDVKRVCMNLQM